MGQRETPSGDRGVAYVRVSGDKQDTASQKASIRRWLDQHGLDVRTWYEDVGARHEAFKRAEFQAMLAAVRSGDAHWIIVDSKDRFGTRNAYEFGKFATELREHDCELWSVTAGCLTDDDYATEILTAVDSVRSRDEQHERSKRAIRGMIQGWQEGRANGGYPPYGYDVACVGPDGKERWRVVYQGHYKRAKVWSDGREERYDGKANFPARDQSERLEIVPSRDPRQVEVVQSVYRWYTTESITYGMIAARLNGLGYDPLYSQAWYGNRVIAMLKNPAYLVGRSVGNKVSSGEFYEFRAGLSRRAPTSRGRALPYRKHDESDYIFPREWGTGIIDRDLWDRVQAKLKGIHSPRRSPRSPELWLAQYLYCGSCDLRMSGWTQRNHKRDPYSYVCSSFRRYGAANKHGCRLHRVKHSDVVPLVERWLADTGRKLDEVLDAAPAHDAVDAAGADLGRAERDYCRLITAVWATMKKWGVPHPAGRPWAANTLGDAFRAHAPKHQADERAELARLRTQYEEAAERYLELPTRAREVVRVRLDAMEKEIAALEERLRPLDAQLADLRGELVAARERVLAAQEACRGSGNRQKAQALAGVLARIVCHFEHYQSVPKKRQTAGQKGRKVGTDRSRLERAVFEPLAGAGVAIRPDVRSETAGSPRSSSASSTGRSAPLSPPSSAIRSRGTPASSPSSTATCRSARPRSWCRR